MRISEFLCADAVIADLRGASPAEVLAELCRPLAREGLDAKQLLEILMRRERLGSTGVGDGFAIPHGTYGGPSRFLASFGRSRRGIEFNALDGKPTRFFFALFVSQSSAGPHLQALARVSRIFMNPAFREAVLDAHAAADIYRLILEADARVDAG